MKLLSGSVYLDDGFYCHWPWPWLCPCLWPVPLSFRPCPCLTLALTLALAQDLALVLSIQHPTRLTGAQMTGLSLSLDQLKLDFQILLISFSANQHAFPRHACTCAHTHTFKLIYYLIPTHTHTHTHTISLSLCLLSRDEYFLLLSHEFEPGSLLCIETVLAC